ncbi:MAG: hypothetical protein C5B49_00130 [Bdellovibrio sp.]|nr:MAG: hypothetical protein C5B49_00130 [Bdellovibrio sp.]
MSKSNQSIEFLEIPARAAAEGPKAPTWPAQQAVFLFHGFGADAYDLKSLAEVLTPPQPESTHWIFPQGVMAVPIGPGWFGRAWWPIDMSRLERAVQKGGMWDLDHRPPELPALRARLLAWVSSFGYSWDQIILGGFSQGAMLSCDLFLHAPETPKGLVLFSGALINRAEWATVASHRKSSRFFQSHGRQDPVLPFRAGAQLETFLIQQGLKGSLFAFEGTHEIPRMVIDKANAYLQQLHQEPPKIR